MNTHNKGSGKSFCFEEKLVKKLTVPRGHGTTPQTVWRIGTRSSDAGGHMVRLAVVRSTHLTQIHGTIDCPSLKNMPDATVCNAEATGA